MAKKEVQIDADKAKAAEVAAKKAILEKQGALAPHKRTFAELESRIFKITTGSLIFDIFLEGGFGAGLGRFYGEPEHGKTLQALTWAKNWLLKFGDKGKIIYFDCEGRLTPKKLRLSKITEVPNFEERIEFWRINTFDDIAKYIKNLIDDNKDGMHYFIVFDSLDMLITKADLEKGFGDAAKVGAAQVMATLLMKHVGVFMQDRGHHLHILSQIRANINTSNPNSPKTKMSGANALRHQCDIGGDILKNFGGADGSFIYENPAGSTVKEKGNIVGHYCTIKFNKTTNEKTGQVIRIPIKRGAGIWREREVCDLALAFGLISKKGSWFNLSANIAEKMTADFKKNGVDFTPELAWQGYETLFSYFEDNKVFLDWFENELKQTLTYDSVAQTVEDTDEA